MKYLHTLSLLAALVPGLASAEVRVVATLPDLAALARPILGDRGTVTALSLATQDPHFVDARPSLALELSRADLLLAAGLELEIGWLPNLQVGSRNPKIMTGAAGYLDCSTVVRRLEIPTQKIDRSMGDIHPGGNPHYLYDPRQALVVIDALAERLAAIDPEGAAGYRARAAQERAALSKKIDDWSRRMAPFRGAKVVSYHRSLVYLADWLGLEIVDHVEPKPGIPPNPGHIAGLLVKMRQAKVQAILQEAHHPRTTAELLTEKSGAKLVVFVGGAKDGESYADHLEALIRALESTLSKGGPT